MIIRTKLHRPPVTGHYVHRPRLLEYLDQQRKLPVIMVTAPAGYGKSTLVSCWVDKCNNPCAWLSLDSQDNDLRQFLSYFLAAIDSIFPDAVNRTLDLVKASNLPSLSMLTGGLLNELNSIGQDFHLVLDDIQSIEDKSVHDFLDTLLRHPLRFLHLVLIGRRDPFLAISALRGKNQLGEIRQHDLRFTNDETAIYLQKILNIPIDVSTSAAWTARVEGWITGLHLAAIFIKHNEKSDSLLPKIDGNFEYVGEYLFNEVLSNLPPAFKNCLLKLSPLNRFSAPLCDAICDDSDAPNPLDGLRMIKLLKKENLFLIALDTENRWFRFHHRFQELLQNQLQRHQSSEEIGRIHLRASEWFETQGLATEAIEHALASGDGIRAAEIVEAQRYTELFNDRWYVISRWLTMLPADIVRSRVKLLLTNAWIANLQHNISRAKVLLEQAGALMPGNTDDSLIAGEFAFLQGYVSYFEGQSEQSRLFFEMAVSKLYGQKSPFWSEAELMVGLTRLSGGQKKLAVTSLMTTIKKIDPTENYQLSRLIAGLIFIYLINGELHSAKTWAKRLLHLSKQHDMHLTEAWSYYFLACTYMHTGRFKSASRHFAQAIERRYVLEPRAAMDAFAGLTLSQQLLGLDSEAAESCSQLESFAVELQGESHLAAVHSCQLRLAIARGSVVPRLELYRPFDIPSSLAEIWMWLEDPLITQARGLIAEDTKDSLEQAASMLQTIRGHCEAAHITCQLIETMVLQSLSMGKMGRTDEALNTLKQVIAIAGPLGWVRPFVEAGPKMVSLLKQLQRKNVFTHFIVNILSAFPEVAPEVVQKSSKLKLQTDRVLLSEQASKQPLIEPLTNRELDIMELLAERQQNKEIAGELCISPVTVKTHLQNIFRKLGVCCRREAVQEAKRLHII